ncbi:MAG: calcium/sodium antiporter [Candidatus Altiarchaeota archaeon]
MIEAAIAFLGGLVVLLKGSDLFVSSSVKIAKYIGLSEIVIGLTLVSVGTSLPELASSVAAASTGNTLLVTGNVIGSNIANIGLILGLCAVIGTLNISEEVYYRDGFILIGVSFLFYWLASDGVISALNGLTLLLVFGLYMGYLFKARPQFKSLLRIGEWLYVQFPVYKAFEPKVYKKIVEKSMDSQTYKNLIAAGMHLGVQDKAFKKGLDPATYRRILVSYEEKLRKEIVREFLIAALGFAAIYYGAKYMVDGAVSLASTLGVSQNVIGLTLIALGTSMPELVVSMTSVRKGFGNIVLGNVIGSNIANISLVAGLSSIVSPVLIPARTLAYTLPLMILLSVMAVIFIRSGWKVKKAEGIIFLASYFLIMIWVVFS